MIHLPRLLELIPHHFVEACNLRLLFYTSPLLFFDELILSLMNLVQDHFLQSIQCFHLNLFFQMLLPRLSMHPKPKQRKKYNMILDVYLRMRILIAIIPASSL